MLAPAKAIIEAGIRAGVEPLRAYLLVLAVHGFYHMPIVTQRDLVGKRQMRLHSGTPHWDAPHASVFE